MSDFTTIKERVNLAECIVGRTGGKISNAGTDTLNLAPCPFCGGRTCFRVTPSKQKFHCFKCPDDQAGGDVFDFVQRHDVCDKATALQKLAKEYGVELTRTPEKARRSPEKEKAQQERNTIFEETAAYYHAALFDNNKAIGYQRKVRMHSNTTLKTFRVGHTDGRLCDHLQTKGYTADQIVESGLAKRKKDRLQDFFGYDLFIYPHLDKTQSVGGFTIKDQKGKFKYRLPGKHWSQNCIFYNMRAFMGKEVFLVEGENDLLSVYGRGGLQHVAAINGQISKDQLDYLTLWAPGKIIYLCFDNDDSGKGYTDKVCKALKKMCLPKTLAGLLKGEVTDVRIIRFGEKGDDIDEYLRSQNDPTGALKGLIKGAERYFQPLLALKELYKDWAKEQNKDQKFNFDTYGKICFEWFQARGKYFIEGEDCNLYFNTQTYRIGNNTPFKALLYEEAGINGATSGASHVIQSIESQAYRKGDRASTGGWIYTNIAENTVYFNLCDASSNLLKISPGKIETVSNGINTEQILLKSSPNMKPISFHRKANVRKGMESLKANLFDNLTCNVTDRYFVVCLLINTVLLQYVRARGVNRFSGSNSCGKTSGAGLVSTIIMGENLVTTGSAASNFSEAAVSPLVILDNLESDAVRGGQRDFLLTTATGVARQKRKAGTDSDNVYERSCAQVVVTAIEPFAEPELIQRANEIVFDKEFFNPAFKEATAIEADIKKDRNLIWSTIFKIIAFDILPDIERKKSDALSMLNKDYPGHSKSRLNELYAMLYLILGEVVKYIPQPGQAIDPSDAQWIFNIWISEQNQRAFATEAGSNKILQNLEALVKEHGLRPDRFEKEYGLKAEEYEKDARGPRKIVFTASTGELHRAFDLVAKERGTRNPFKNPGQLGARIKGSLETLTRGGWSFERNAKTIRGVRLHQFVREYEL